MGGRRSWEMQKAYYSMELGPLVALRPVLDLVLACAELSEVLGGSWHDIFEELECYSAQGLTWIPRKIRKQFLMMGYSDSN